MLFALLLLQPAPAMSLTCTGGGIAYRADTETVYGSENVGNSAWPTVRAERSERFEGQVQVRVSEGESWIRLPEVLLPKTHAGEPERSKLKISRTTDGVVRGSAAINLLNNPRVEIDLATKTIRVTGNLGRYRGKCEPTQLLG